MYLSYPKFCHLLAALLSCILKLKISQTLQNKMPHYIGQHWQISSPTPCAVDNISLMGIYFIKQFYLCFTKATMKQSGSRAKEDVKQQQRI